MTRLDHEMHAATVHATRGWDGASRIAWRSLLATVGGAFGVVLLATPCYAQTAATAAAETSVSGLPSVEVGGATEHNGNAIRPFRINVPEEALADLRRRWWRRDGPSARLSRINRRVCSSRRSSHSSSTGAPATTGVRRRRR